MTLKRWRFSELGKGRLAYISPKCRAIIPISKEYFSIFNFYHVAPFGYDKSVNEGAITFLGKIWGNFPLL